VYSPIIGFDKLVKETSIFYLNASEAEKFPHVIQLSAFSVHLPYKAKF
jgi:hypothetical protein